MVVFLTSLAVGHDTRRISARTSRRNCAVRVKNPAVCARAAGLRSRRTVGAVSGKAPLISFSSSLIDTRLLSISFLAGVPGFEPGLSVLETDVLTVDTIPLLALPICDCRCRLK